MNAIKLVFNVIEWSVFIYLGFASFYIFVFSIAAKMGYKPKAQPSSKLNKIAVLIPGYKEDAVIIEVAEDAIKQDYPIELYDVIIIADSFSASTIMKLKTLPIILIEVSFEKSTKSKALNKAMSKLTKIYDIAVVLDADNLMESDFLSKINHSYNQGFIAIQGHRIAKNLNTNMAVLDAISEEVNNHIFRLGHRAMGLSSALIGSGMAFDYVFFKNLMANINAVGGFDKELEMKLLQSKRKIEYLENAIVYDEKVQNQQVFQNQRKRWLSAQFVYFGRYFFPGLRDLILKGNIDFADKVYQMIQPPRVILLGLISIITGVYLFFDITKIFQINTVFAVNPLLYYLAFGATFFAFVMAIPAKFYNLKTIKAILALPGAFIALFFSFFKLKGANSRFIHTQHGTPPSNKSDFVR